MSYCTCWVVCPIRVWRGAHSRRVTLHAILMPAAAVRLQSALRSFLAKRMLRLLQRQAFAATNLQRLWRGVCSRRSTPSCVLEKRSGV